MIPSVIIVVYLLPPKIATMTFMPQATVLGVIVAPGGTNSVALPT